MEISDEYLYTFFSTFNLGFLISYDKKIRLKKMKIFLILSIFILAFIFIGKKVFYSAKRNLFKDQASWSNKDIIIKYRNSKEIKDSKGIDNYLKVIADESKVYLDEQSKEKEE